MRQETDSNASAAKSSVNSAVKPHQATGLPVRYSRSAARILIAIGLTVYGALAITVAWLCELLIGSIQFCGACITVAVGSLTVHQPLSAKPTPPKAPHLDRQRLLADAEIWDRWARHPRCHDQKQARANAEHYRGLADRLDRARRGVLGVRKSIQAESLIARQRAAGSDLNRSAPEVVPFALSAHEVEPTDAGVRRSATNVVPISASR